MEEDRKFVPQRQLPILPSDAVPGQPYSLPENTLCSVCVTAIIKLASTKRPVTPERFRHNCAKLELGTISEVRHRDYCQLCNIIARAVIELCPPYARDNVSGESEILFLSTDTIDESMEIGISTSRFRIAYLSDVKTESGSRHSWGGIDLQERSRIPQYLAGRSSSQIDFNMVKSWVQECELGHKCKSQQNSYIAGSSECPSILVEVKGRRLIMRECADQHYCALSYVYGDVDVFRTTRSNLSSLQQLNSLDDPKLGLSAIICDAMAFVEAIGEEYLWVDSLCIMYDDRDQLKKEIANMGIIYRRARLTISVISASGANDNIPGTLPESRPTLPMTQLWDRQVFARPLEVHLQLEGSKYESRAWTYQERLLSTRCLYITRSLVYYHCLEKRGSELGSSEQISNSVNPLHSLICDGPRKFFRWHQGMDRESEVSEWIYYYELVRKYSQREMKYSSDVLSAFAGILATLSLGYDTTFCAGLPNSALLICLHWIPGHGRCIAKPVASERRTGFPSWTWAGWHIPVEWLEAVVQPDWWEWEGGLLVNPIHNISLPEAGDNTQILCCGQVATFEHLTTEMSSERVSPENALDPGAGMAIPLIKILDSQRKWCGRLCDCTQLSTLISDSEVLELVLLSTCSARPIHIFDELDQGESRWRWQHPFDTDVFPTNTEDGKSARLCNLFIIGYTASGQAQRRAICQIHADVWEIMHKEEKELILI